MNKEQLVKILNDYFDINDTYCYHLTRDKEAFKIGTIKLDDFVEFDEETINDIVDYIIENSENYGHWIIQGRKLKCSNCSKLMYIGTNDLELLKEEAKLHKYCFNCGARMEEE